MRFIAFEIYFHYHLKKIIKLTTNIASLDWNLSDIWKRYFISLQIVSKRTIWKLFLWPWLETDVSIAPVDLNKRFHNDK